jgi:hypothetical protein
MGDKSTIADTAADEARAVPRDGRWAVVQLMGHKTIAGRIAQDELLSGALLVQTPEADGITLRREYAFNPSGPALYLLSYYSREEVLRLLYPPSPLQLTAPEYEDDPDEEDLDEDNPDGGFGWRAD